MGYIPIAEIEIDQVYYSPNSKIPMKVEGRYWYGNNCEISFIAYTNLEPTYDKPIGHKWMLEESSFIKTFLDKE